MIFETIKEDTHKQLITVILCEPGKKARITVISDRLESLQMAVGGYIEVIYPFDDPVAIICNEEGKCNGMELNRALKDNTGRIYDILAGPFLVVGLTDDNFASLSKELREKYYLMLEYPEIFIRDKNGMRIIQIITDK